MKLTPPLSPILVVALFVATAFAATAIAPPKIRPAAVAGTWYDSSPEGLSYQVNRLLESADPQKVGPRKGESPVALVVPHAGYAFSGKTAASAFVALKSYTFHTAIILGPSHHKAFRGAAASPATAYATPLGQVPVDREICDRLAKTPPFCAGGDAEAREHCIECQLPFLQAINPAVRIVPVLVGDLAEGDAGRLAEPLARLLKNPGTILVISTDLTHYGPDFGYVPFGGDVQGNLRKWNTETADAVVRLDDAAFLRHLRETGDTICGRNAVVVGVKALQKLRDVGDVRGVTAGYSTSGEMTGDWNHCVSYLSTVYFFKDRSKRVVN